MWNLPVALINHSFHEYLIILFVISGSDLLTSLTSTFDRKWKSLVNPSNLLVASSECEAPVVAKMSNRDEVERQDSRTAEVYRDPSLHRTLGEKGHLIRMRSVSDSSSLSIISVNWWSLFAVPFQNANTVHIFPIIILLRNGSCAVVRFWHFIFLPRKYEKWFKT